ncbi:MAG: hypothetical protein ACR652_03230 [Methylocystis sp.]
MACVEGWTERGSQATPHENSALAINQDMVSAYKDAVSNFA